MRELRDYIRIPYADRGRDPERGVDCWGLLRLFYQDQFGIELPSNSSRYSSSDNHEDTSRFAREETEENWVSVAEPGFGDAVVLNIRARPFHVGIYIGEGQFLHALGPGVNTVIERLDAPMWNKRLEGFYRHAKRL